MMEVFTWSDKEEKWLLKDSFQFRLSPEFYDCDEIFTAELEKESNRYLVTGNDRKVFYRPEQVREYFENGFWRKCKDIA